MEKKPWSAVVNKNATRVVGVAPAKANNNTPSVKPVQVSKNVIGGVASPTTVSKPVMSFGTLSKPATATATAAPAPSSSTTVSAPKPAKKTAADFFKKDLPEPSPQTLKRPASSLGDSAKSSNTANVPSHTQRSAGDEYRIFVGNLGPEVTDAILQQGFSRFASLSKVRVITDQHSNKNKGYGFVSFKEGADFLVALKEMNGKYVGSRPVKLKKSDWTDRTAEPHHQQSKSKRHKK